MKSFTTVAINMNGTLGGILGAPSYEENEELFYAMVVLYTFLGVLATVGNGLVIYAACRGRDGSRLKYLGPLIKSLAVSDMLFGMIGTPMLIVFYFICKLSYHTSNRARIIRYSIYSQVPREIIPTLILFYF